MKIDRAIEEYVLLSQEASRLLLGFSPVCERICTLRIKAKFHNITFVNAYAPTEDTADEIVDELYETLQSVCNELPKRDAIITLGDFSAKLSKEQIYRVSQEECARLQENVP